MPLIAAPLNVLLKIVKIVADEGVKNYLEGLGIVVDGNITLLSGDKSVVCKVQDARVALDKVVSTKIFVVPAE